MNIRNNKSLVFGAVLAGSVLLAASVSARPDINAGQKPNGEKRGQLKTTASCKPAEGSIDLDINNVRARLMTGG